MAALKVQPRRRRQLPEKSSKGGKQAICWKHAKFGLAAYAWSEPATCLFKSGNEKPTGAEVATALLRAPRAVCGDSH